MPIRPPQRCRPKPKEECRPTPRAWETGPAAAARQSRWAPGQRDHSPETRVAGRKDLTDQADLPAVQTPQAVARTDWLADQRDYPAAETSAAAASSAPASHRTAGKPAGDSSPPSS